MARMGHDSERAAMIYLHEMRGAGPGVLRHKTDRYAVTHLVAGTQLRSRAVPNGERPRLSPALYLHSFNDRLRSPSCLSRSIDPRR
jgi:hypothetical protein